MNEPNAGAGGGAAGLVHDVTSVDPLDVARYGGKAAGLARMSRLGLPVPPAFVIETAACAVYQDHGQVPPELSAAVYAAVSRLEQAAGKSFAGGHGSPLLVSVRSGAQISMPGMMDTILNLGLDRHSVLRLAAASADPRFAVDTWTRFWAMFADIVLGVDPELLRRQIADARDRAVAGLDADRAGELEDRIVEVLSSEVGPVPIDPAEQLGAAVRAVFDSWDSRRARLYREHHGIRHDLGTAVTVQAMVFGNLGQPAGSGVAFTRDPASGTRELYGEYLAGGQGEDVVAGTRTPVKLADAVPEWRPLVAELRGYGHRLEAEYRDALDIEFTAEAGTLYLLQVRPAKRTAAAAVHIAADLVREGVIPAAEAVRRVDPDQVKNLVSPEFDAAALAAARAAGRVLTTGVSASPGHGSGQAVLDADRAAQKAAGGEPVVLVRPTTSPQDLRGMLAANAIVTARGGATSHAAVVSRALDKPCVVGCEDLQVLPDDGVLVLAGRRYREGEIISVDGGTGDVILGDVPRSVPTRNLDDLSQLLVWADQQSGAAVWPEATSALPVEVARRTGAAGIAIVPLTDLLHASGGLPALLEAIGRYSADPDSPPGVIEEPVTAAVQAALLPLLKEATGLVAHVRIPNLSSARARSWIEKWTALAPHLLQPLGPRRLLAAYAQGAAGAAREAGHAAVTLLIGGITSARELEQFAEIAEPGVAAGAVVQNPAVLADPAALAATGHALWIDLAELVRTTLGQPEELLYIEEQAEAAASPAPQLPALVERLVADLIQAPGRAFPVGARLTSNAVSTATALYDLGIRRFSSSITQAEQLRLVFGQHAGTASTVKESRNG
jgi:pyruvate,orthophosphate dikinase